MRATVHGIVEGSSRGLLLSNPLGASDVDLLSPEEMLDGEPRVSTPSGVLQPMGYEQLGYETLTSLLMLDFEPLHEGALWAYPRR